MKKIIFLLFLLLLIPINVFAVNYNTSVGDDLTYEECTNFQDSVVSSATSGYFGHCEIFQRTLFIVSLIR